MAKVSVGNETVLFRHEKTFYHKPGLFLRVNDNEGVAAIAGTAKEADAFSVDYVGIDLFLDGFAVEAASGDASDVARPRLRRCAATARNPSS